MTEKATPMGERVATVESWIRGHEKLCADRYGLLMKVIAVGGAILISVAGWGLAQVYRNQEHQMDLLNQLASRPAASVPR